MIADDPPSRAQSLDGFGAVVLGDPKEAFMPLEVIVDRRVPDHLDSSASILMHCDAKGILQMLLL
jgi:hypothetical protein